MKYCEECATKLRNDAEYCYTCGAPCRDIGDLVLYEDRYAAWKKARNKKEKTRRRVTPGQVIGTVLLLLLLFAAMGYVFISPARRSFSAAITGEAEKARSLYEEQVQGNRVEAIFLRLLIPRGVSEVGKAWAAGTLSYPEAAERLAVLAELEYPLNHAAKRAEELENENRSQEAYDAGAAYEAEGQYREAMLAYRQVAEEDSLFKHASERATAMESEYKTALLTSLGVPETIAEYERGVAAMEEGLTLLKGDATLTEALQTYKQTFAVRIKAATLPVATAYIQKGYYKEAIELLNRALLYNPQDLDLKTLLTKAVTDYEGFVQSQVRIYLANEDPDGALALIQRALEDLPEDVVLTKLLQSVEG